MVFFILLIRTDSKPEMQQPCGLLLAAGLDGGNTLHCTSGTMATSPFGVAKTRNTIHPDGVFYFVNQDGLED